MPHDDSRYTNALEARRWIPPFNHFVDIFDLPEDDQEIVREVSSDDEYRTHEYRDGNYYWRIDLTKPAPIPDDTDEEDQTIETWLDRLKARLSPEVIKANRFAIYVWH